MKNKKLILGIFLVLILMIILVNFASAQNGAYWKDKKCYGTLKYIKEGSEYPKVGECWTKTKWLLDNSCGKLKGYIISQAELEVTGLNKLCCCKYDIVGHPVKKTKTTQPSTQGQQEGDTNTQQPGPDEQTDTENTGQKNVITNGISNGQQENTEITQTPEEICKEYLNQWQWKEGGVEKWMAAIPGVKDPSDCSKRCTNLGKPRNTIYKEVCCCWNPKGKKEKVKGKAIGCKEKYPGYSCIDFKKAVPELQPRKVETHVKVTINGKNYECYTSKKGGPYLCGTGPEYCCKIKEKVGKECPENSVCSLDINNAKTCKELNSEEAEEGVYKKLGMKSENGKLSGIYEVYALKDESCTRDGNIGECCAARKSEETKPEAEVTPEIEKKAEEVKEKVEEEKAKILKKPFWKKALEWLASTPLCGYNYWEGPEAIALNVIGLATGLHAGIQAGQIIGKCVPETPLAGNEKCLSCNGVWDPSKQEYVVSPYKICSKERCLILGNCEPVEIKEKDGKKGYYDINLKKFIEYKGNSPVMCLPKECRDTSLPKITEISTEWYIDESNFVGSCNTKSGRLIINKRNCKDIKWGPDVRDSLPWNTSMLILTIKTEKNAMCRFSIDKRDSSFEEMTDFEDNYLYPLSQRASISTKVLGTGQEHIIYIKCKNVCGYTHSKDFSSYLVKFRIGNTPDWVPPYITYIDPENNFYVNDNIKTLNVEMWLSENVGLSAGSRGCKFYSVYNYTSRGENYIKFFTTNWSLMYWFENPDPTSAVRKGYCLNNRECTLKKMNECAHCYLTLDLTRGYSELHYENMTEDMKNLLGTGEKNLTSKQFFFIFRCWDKDRNIGDPYFYKIMTLPPYDILILKPNMSDPDYDPYDLNPDIDVRTTRPTYCKYATSTTLLPQTSPQLNWSKMEFIDEKLSEVHLGKVSENYTLKAYPNRETTNYFYAKCRDSAGLEIMKYTILTTKKDTEEPIIIRMYHNFENGDVLHIETNEVSSCTYNINDVVGCGFEFEEGEKMPEDNSVIHAAPWREDVIYYVKCKDIFDNGPLSKREWCTAVIHPYEVPVYTGT